MARSIRQALVVYKKSAWEQYAKGRRGRVIGASARAAMLRTHKRHLDTLDAVKRELARAGVSFRSTSRTDLEPMLAAGREPDLFVSIGGDGTFLETSHHVRRGLLLGVNSSPEDSVGFFCAATRKTFASALDRLLAGRAAEVLLQRLEVKAGGRRLPTLALNDVLVTHASPGATSRYVLRIGGVEEFHRSSGVWISTAAGSTAGIRAAGGTRLPITSDRFQFVVRELYRPPGHPRFRLGAGVLRAGDEIRLVSRMADGTIFVDGPRHRTPLTLGERVTVRLSKRPLRAMLDAPI